MKFTQSIVNVIAVLAGVVNAASRTSPPSGAIYVAKSGGQYTTLQAAINSLSTTSTTAQVIFMGAGTYSEQVLIPARKAKLTIYGYTTDTTSYGSNQVKITHSAAAASGLSDDATGTLRVKCDYFSLYNIIVENSYGSGSQAIALSAYGSYGGYYGCQILGYQDTLLAEQGYQFYGHTYIRGATDYIFGQTCIAWFSKCELACSAGTITASGRSSSSNPSWYVFDQCNIYAYGSVSAGSVYLGRPWSNYARVVFQKTAMSNIINSAGWEQWSSSTPNTDHVLFGEYSNTGAGASGTRASFATKLSSPETISGILGSSYTSWVDTSYV